MLGLQRGSDSCGFARPRWKRAGDLGSLFRGGAEGHREKRCLRFSGNLAGEAGGSFFSGLCSER